MRRLDVVALRGARSATVTYVLVLQRTSMLDLPTILVAPLFPTGVANPSDPIRPTVELLERVATYRNRPQAPQRAQGSSLEHFPTLLAEADWSENVLSKTYRIEMLEIAAIGRRKLGETVASLEALDYRLGIALDALLFGP